MKFLFTLLLLQAFQLSAQLLNNSSGEVFSDQPFFNIENVRENKIKRITGHYSTKKINDQIRPSKLIYVYEFDTLGRLIQQYETIQINNTIDTIVTHYEYDPSGNIYTKRRADNNGFYAYVYSYDSVGRIIREEYRRALNKNGSRLNFLQDKSFLITYETSSYQNFPKQEKRTFYNSYGNPFQEKITYFDDEGLLKEEVEKLKVTSGQKKTTYTYNHQGLLGAVETTSTIMGNSSIKNEFTYDQHTNLISKNIYRNGEHTTEIQVIYNEKTGLISAILTKQVSTNFITILRWDSYEFYE
jgi:hypothetical protein